MHSSTARQATSPSHLSGQEPQTLQLQSLIRKAKPLGMLQAFQLWLNLPGMWLARMGFSRLQGVW